MKFIKTILILVFANIILINNSYAQQKMEYIDGEVIIQIKKSFDDIDLIINKNKSFNGIETKLELVEILSKTMNIWLLKFDHEMVDHEKFVQQLALNKNIIEFQNNYYVKLRSTTPNDPSFSQQWQYINNGGSGGIVDADIDADLAWDITTGGLTPYDDTIVVCIVDDGILETHEDLIENLWINYNEIPNNGVDDDNNGYIDDYRGYNANDDDDDIFSNAGFFGVHGNAVAGVVGAKGNNNIGVTGVNWNVKLMIVKNQGATQSQVIKAYSYPLEMRTLYNTTNGLKGAFVVAVNSSWGIDFGDPDNVPLWCAFYDEMGEAGILNAAATANANSNVDVVGDLPTACSSDYLVTVTNVKRNDVKETNAGFGLTTIDLGAFGEDAYIISQFDTDGYGNFGGTSGATPQVAGAIALLYSAPYSTFADLYLSDPAAAALKAKEYIMEGAESNTSLQGITVSGARLNLMGMLDKLAEEHSNCPNISNVKLIGVSDSTAEIEIELDDASSVTSYEILYKISSSSTWESITSTSNIITISGLLGNSIYGYQAKVHCGESSSPLSSFKTFTTNYTSLNSFAVKNGIDIFPNPVKDIITIQLDELQYNFEVAFYDVSGKLLYEGVMSTKKKKIDISVLDNGIYLLKLKDQKGNIYTNKINKI